MVATRDYKLVIGLMEWDLYAKQAGNEIEILVLQENGKEIAKAKLLKNDIFLVEKGDLSNLEVLGVERILEFGRKSITRAFLDMRLF